MIENLKRSFARAPLTWIVTGLLAFSVYSHYQTGKQFSRVCTLIGMLREGYFDVPTAETLVVTGIDMDAVMVKVDQQARLLMEETQQGRAFRWWRAQSGAIERICDSRAPDEYVD